MDSKPTEATRTLRSESHHCQLPRRGIKNTACSTSRRTSSRTHSSAFACQRRLPAPSLRPPFIQTSLKTKTVAKSPHAPTKARGCREHSISRKSEKEILSFYRVSALSTKSRFSPRQVVVWAARSTPPCMRHLSTHKVGGAQNAHTTQSFIERTVCVQVLVHFVHTLCSLVRSVFVQAHSPSSPRIRPMRAFRLEYLATSPRVNLPPAMS